MSNNLKGVQKPLKSKPTNQNLTGLSKQTSTPSSTSSTSNPSLSLSKLGSFKRNKTPKPSTGDAVNRTKRSEKKKQKTDLSYPSNWTNLQTGPFAPTNGGRVRSLKKTSRKRPVQESEETPWMNWLRKAAEDYQSTGKGKAKMVEPVVEEEEDEVLVGEQSWESPSDRSATPNLDDPGPSSTILPLPSSSRPRPPPTTTSQPPEPVQQFDPLLAPNLSIPRLPSSSSNSTSSSISKLRYSPHSSIPQSTSSNWYILHCGGIPSTLSDLEIYQLIRRNHQNFFSTSYRPIAIRTSRPRRNSDNTTSLAFIAFETEKSCKIGLELLKLGSRGKQDQSVACSRIHVSHSNTPASEVKWFGSEMIEYWEELLKKQELKEKEEKEEEEQSKKRKLGPTTTTSSSSLNQSIRSDRRPLPPPPPPPPPPAPAPPPSQALLEALLSELRKTTFNIDDENHYTTHHHQQQQQCYYDQPLYPLVTYDPNLDPRRKKRRKF